MKGRAGADCRRRLGLALVCLVPVSLGACADEGPYADDASWPQPTYFTVVVRPGDTVSAIAARYDVPAPVVTSMNDLDARSDIHAGQILRVPARSHGTETAVSKEAGDLDAHNYAPPPKPVEVARTELPQNYRVRVRDLPPPQTRSPSDPSPAPAASPPEQTADAEPAHSDSGPAHFLWPLQGRVISSFGSDGNGERNDGINIAAAPGTPIHAAAAGAVTYAGNELKGYGNLILIKHDDGYITAYAHAQSISVNRGDHVERGQVIGTAGATGDVDSPQLHFEIRKDTQPVNPRLLLAAR